MTTQQISRAMTRHLDPPIAYEGRVVDPGTPMLLRVGMRNLGKAPTWPLPTAVGLSMAWVLAATPVIDVLMALVQVTGDLLEPVPGAGTGPLREFPQLSVWPPLTVLGVVLFLAMLDAGIRSTLWWDTRWTGPYLKTSSAALHTVTALRRDEDGTRMFGSPLHHALWAVADAERDLQALHADRRTELTATMASEDADRYWATVQQAQERATDALANATREWAQWRARQEQAAAARRRAEDEQVARWRGRAALKEVDRIQARRTDGDKTPQGRS